MAVALPFEAVIFDLDGLLLDTERLALAAGVEALAAMGHEVAEEVFVSLIGIDAVEGHRILCDHLGCALDAAALDAAWLQAMDARMACGVPLRPGVHATLAALDARTLPRAVATNSATARATAKLAAAGLGGRFATIVGFDAVPRGKPAPDVYLEAARRLGATPARCLALEDSDTGVRAAHAAGMTVVQIPDMHPSRERLAHHQAASLAEALALFGL